MIKLDAFKRLLDRYLRPVGLVHHLMGLFPTTNLHGIRVRRARDAPE